MTSFKLKSYILFKLMILSIDVGIRNLAMCMLDENRENLVTDWDVSGAHPNIRMVFIYRSEIT